jgi:hypothetical protein
MKFLMKTKNYFYFSTLRKTNFRKSYDKYSGLKSTNKNEIISKSNITSIIKINKKIDSDNDRNDNENFKSKRRLLEEIIENPQTSKSISEKDIHKALEHTGQLPEIELKNIIQNYENENKLIIGQEINEKIIKHLPILLNKSIVEICKIGKKNPDIFKNYEYFWIKIEDEILTRADSLTNEYITDIIFSFSKFVTNNIKIYERMEETIIESEAQFTPSQIEKIFFAYCLNKKGSTALLKRLSGKYFQHYKIIDSWKLAKFVSELNSHPQTVKNNFGHIPQLEEQIKNDINSQLIKFEQLIDLACVIFNDNLCINEIQLLIENTLIEKFKNGIYIDVSKVVKLLKSMSNYYLKNENLFWEIKNYFNFYISTYDQTKNENKILINKENFNEQRPKVISNLNMIIWAFSKNEFIKNIKDASRIQDLKSFSIKLKDLFIQNMAYYNERETVFCIEGLIKLFEDKNDNINFIFSKEENDLICKKILSLSNFSSNEVIKLLKMFTKYSSHLKNLEVVEKLIKYSFSIFDQMKYIDLIDFVDLVYNFPYEFENNFLINAEKLNFFESRLIKILDKIEIRHLCKLFAVSSKPLLFHHITNDFKVKMINSLQIRRNEIQKDDFLKCLSSCIDLKHSDLINNLLEILQDLSNFQNVRESFNKPEESLNLLWSFLTIYMNDIPNVKLNNTSNRFLTNTINSFLIESSPGENVSSTFNKFLTSFNLNIFLTDNISNKDDLVKKYIQTVYLAFLYLKKSFPQTNQSEYGSLFENINKELSTHLFKFDVLSRGNVISKDPASKCDKEILKSLEKELLKFFVKKPNASIYPNFIDEFINPINYVIYFEKPSNLSSGEVVIGIDSKKYAILILNNYYFIDNPNKITSQDNNNLNFFTFLDNRINLLKEVFEWEVIVINENEWGNTADNEKQNFLKTKFGFDFSDPDMTKIRIAKKSNKDTDTKDIKPKFKLTQNLILK